MFGRRTQSTDATLSVSPANPFFGRAAGVEGWWRLAALALVLLATSVAAGAQRTPGSNTPPATGSTAPGSLGAPSRADAVQWSAALEPAALHPGETGRVVLTARIASGWHIYSVTQPAGGPVATRLSLDASPTLQPVGTPQQPKPDKVFDTGFRINVEEFPRSVAFGLPFKLAPTAPAGPLRVSATTMYQACNAQFCLPPKTLHLTATGQVTAGPVRPEFSHAPAAPPAQPAPSLAIQSVPATRPAVSNALPPAAAAESADVAGQVQNAEKQGLARFLLLAITFGFLALATPCVFPMIPITVSFFTKREGELEEKNNGKRGSNLVAALVYCLGIVGTFTGLGLLLAILFGASGIARFAANPWVNLVIAVIFLGLAANLMGYFELSLPSVLVNRTSSLSGRGGLLGTLLMGLTFTLTSFTCTVPFVGTLLVSTAQGGWIWPAIGMLAFSSAFALPFFLLALFPGLLGKLPRSGTWLVSVKAFMGFLEIAAAVKFLSNADLVWQAHFLTRPVFLVIWSIIGIASGLYLLGVIRLAHADRPRLGPGRKILGSVMLAVGVYCFAGIWGAPLGWFDAYLPPTGYSFRSKASGPHAGGEWFSSFDQAQAVARAEHRPLFIDFTGYTCTNCRWMEDHVFPKPAVQQELAQFVRVQLYTDGAGAEYDRNRDLEQRLWDTVALPLYGVATPDGRPLRDASGAPVAFAGLNQDPAVFARFLKAARVRAENVSP